MRTPAEVGEVRGLAAPGVSDRDTPSAMRLDEDKLETLRRWGQGLLHAGSEEQAAAGRAILMLIEEVDRLQIELQHAHRGLRPAASPVSGDETAEDLEEPASTLQERLQRVLRRDSPSETRPSSDNVEVPFESAAPAASPQSWIEALRRQK
jgi:hypothetical protein